MKWYLADVIEHLLITACALVGHARGCWLLNSSPLRRLYWWAVNVRWNDDITQHTKCPLCRFDRTQYDNARRERLRDDPTIEEPFTVTTLGGTSTVWQFNAATGAMRKLS